MPIFRRRDARQNAEEDAARDGGGDSEAEEDLEGGATGEARREEGAVEAEGTAAAGRPVITVRVTQDAETGRRTFNIRQVIRGKIPYMYVQWFGNCFPTVPP